MLQQQVFHDKHRMSQKDGKNVLIMKNYLKFVKDVPMIHVNFIIIVIVVTEEKTEDISFVHRLS